MASDPNAPRSRRALLAAAAGGAAAVAASAAMPLTAAAAPVNMQTEQDNPTVAQTSVTQSAAGSVAFKARTTNTDAAGLVGSTGDETVIDDDTQFTGVYGFSQADDTDALGSGVWGSSPDTGVVGTGSTGVLGLGTVGVVGVGDPGGIGVVAVGASNTDLALYVDGKVHFTRAGRASIGTGKSSVKVTLPGTTSQSRVFALLHSNRSNRWVRAVVPTTGSFTVYLNASMTSATWVAWFVID